MAATGLKSDSLVKKNFFKICLLAFAGSIIYGLPYFRYYYYDAYLAAYGLNNSQMGTLGKLSPSPPATCVRKKD